MPELAHHKTARDRNLALWLLIPIWLAAAVGSVYATLQLEPESMTVGEIGWVILQGAMIVTGVIILANRPRNLIGRLILGAGVSFAASWVLFIAGYPMLSSGDVGGAGLVEAISNAAATLWVPLLIAAFVYFPDGSLPSPRWRWVGPTLWVTGALSILAPLTNGGWAGDEATALRANPLREFLHPLGEILAAAFGVGLVVSMSTACAAIIVRFRRSRGVTRQQMKWLAFAALLQILWFPVELAISGSVASTGYSALVGAMVLTASLAAIAAAVLRYRLYEIDRIISRTVSYALVVALVVGIFAGGVTLLSSLLPTDSPLAVAASTLAVAALFNPARKKVQALVDRRFNRNRYHSQQLVDRFTTDLRDQTHVDQLAAGLKSVVQETLHPSALGMWLSDRR
jgi:hypothetical protein